MEDGHSISSLSPVIELNTGELYMKATAGTPKPVPVPCIVYRNVNYPYPTKIKEEDKSSLSTCDDEPPPPVSPPAMAKTERPDDMGNDSDTAYDSKVGYNIETCSSYSMDERDSVVSKLEVDVDHRQLLCLACATWSKNKRKWFYCVECYRAHYRQW